MIYFIGYFGINFLFLLRCSNILGEDLRLPLILLMAFGSLVMTAFYHYLIHYRRMFNGDSYSGISLTLLMSIAAPLAPFGYEVTVLLDDKISLLLLIASVIYFFIFSRKMTISFVKLLPIDSKDGDLKLFFREYPPRHYGDIKNIGWMFFLMLLMPFIVRGLH